MVPNKSLSLPLPSSAVLCMYFLIALIMIFIVPIRLKIVAIRQVYHSSFVDEEGITKACGCPLLPLKSHIKGPAPVSDQGWIYVLSASLGIMFFSYS